MSFDHKFEHLRHVYNPLSFFRAIASFAGAQRSGREERKMESERRPNEDDADGAAAAQDDDIHGS